MFIAFLAAPLGKRRSQSPLQTLCAECQALMIPQVIVRRLNTISSGFALFLKSTKRLLLSAWRVPGSWCHLFKEVAYMWVCVLSTRMAFDIP